MPTYVYQCKKEKHDYVEIRGMDEEQRELLCPICKSELVRKYGAPSITFKGTGFNSTRG